MGDAAPGAELELGGHMQVCMQLDQTTKELARVRLQYNELRQQVQIQQQRQRQSPLQPPTPQAPTVANGVAVGTPDWENLSNLEMPSPCGWGNLDFAAGTPDWGKIAQPAEQLLGSAAKVAELAESVNLELADLHQQSGLVLPAEGMAEGTPVQLQSQRRALSGLQEQILEHVASLSTSVADAIADWHKEAASPAPRAAADKVGGLKDRVIQLSAGFQRSMGGSSSGWADPVSAQLETAPSATQKFAAVAAHPADMLVAPSDRSASFHSAGGGAISFHSLAHRSSVLFSDVSGDGIAAGLDWLPGTVTGAGTTSAAAAVSHFEQSLPGQESALSDVLARSAAKSEAQGEAERFRELRAALLQAHEDYVRTAVAEKQVSLG